MITEKITLENRAYKEDATPEEIQAIKDRVFIHDDQVIYYKEVPVISPFTIQLMFDEVEKYSNQLGKHGLVIDLRESKRPDAPTRREINKRFSLLCEKLSHVSFCTGKNFLINTAARFVMYQTNLNSFTINKTIESAIEAVKDKVNQ